LDQSSWRNFWDARGAILFFCSVHQTEMHFHNNKYMFRWFGSVEKIDERRLTKEIYKADVGDNA
jgi:hypothetical protein